MCIYYSAELLEVVPEDQQHPAFKLLVGRLYNAGVKVRCLQQSFGADRKTMQRWGRALPNEDPQQLVQALAGRGPRKFTPEIRVFVTMCFPQIYCQSRVGYSQRVRAEIQAVFGVKLSGECLRPLFQQLKAELRHELSEPAAQDPDTPPRFVAQRTLEDWYYAFKKGGFDGLKPKQRCDRGKPRRLSAAQQQWILERVRSFPGVPVKLLYRQWKQTDPTLPALSAVYRWLEQNDLDAQGRRYLLRQNIPGPTKAFEAPGVNDLWMVDFSPGPFLSLHPKTVATHLCVTRLERVVRKDGTVRMANDLYEVNLALRGLQVQLELDPWVMNPILVRYKGQDFGAARKVDRHLNSQIDTGRSQP